MNRLDQYILHDKPVIDKIIEAAELNNYDTVFEIGSGNGILTKELCKIAKHVISCEIDSKMYNLVKQLKYDNLELYNIDGFKYGLTINFDKFISNIPYSRSRDAIELLARKEFKVAVMTVQKEFAKKLLMDNKAIAIIARYCFDIEYVCNVSRFAFKPVPNVDSAIIKLRKKNTLDIQKIKSIKLLYSFKGRKVKHAARALSLNVDNIISEKRIETLKPEEVIAIIK